MPDKQYNFWLIATAFQWMDLEASIFFSDSDQLRFIWCTPRLQWKWQLLSPQTHPGVMKPDVLGLSKTNPSPVMLHNNVAKLRLLVDTFTHVWSSGGQANLSLQTKEARCGPSWTSSWVLLVKNAKNQTWSFQPSRETWSRTLCWISRSRKQSWKMTCHRKAQCNSNCAEPLQQYVNSAEKLYS